MGNIWSKVRARFHSESMAPPTPNLDWVNPSPFKKDTPLIHPHRHSLSIHSGRDCSTTLQARTPLPFPPLPSPTSWGVRLLHKLPLWEDNKPYHPSSQAWVRLHTGYRCNASMQMIPQNRSNSSASATKTIMTVKRLHLRLQLLKPSGKH